MASPQGNFYQPFHVIFGDPSTSNPTLQSLLHAVIEDPLYHSHESETHKHGDGHKAENAVVRHQVHLRHHHTITPVFDVHETNTAYFLEGEFPGIEDKNAIVIEKVGSRTLAVETKLSKLNLHDEWRAEPRAGLFKQFEQGDQVPTQAEDTATQEIPTEGVKEPESVPAALDEEAPAESGEKETEIEAGDTLRAPSWIQMTETKIKHEEGVKPLISERRVGLLGRSFTFPKAVDFDGLKAKLRGGLLRIMIPKAQVHEKPKRQRILIVD